MTRFAAVLFANLGIASVGIAEAHGQSASSTLKGLDECFAQTRAAEAACDQAGSDTTTRIGCRLRAHSAEKQCFDGVFANRDEAARPSDKLRARPPPGPPATEPLAPAVPPDQVGTTAALPTAKGWLISETTSPRDFSPLLVAKLYALAPVATDGPGILVLRCWNQRTEMSLGATGVWRALRGGDVEVTISSDRLAARPLRWRLAADGRTATMMEDPVDIMRALDGGRTSISVTDGAGSRTSAIFDLAGIDVVRNRLASACRWPNAKVELRGR